MNSRNLDRQSSALTAMLPMRKSKLLIRFYGMAVIGKTLSILNWLQKQDSNLRHFGYSWRFQIRTGFSPLSPTAECSATELFWNKTNLCRTSFFDDVQNLLLKHVRKHR